MPEWTVAPAEAGARLDKYLAAPERAGSRPKAAVALERGKIFVNDREMTLADAAARVERAVAATVAAGTSTRDLGGTASTTDFTAAVIHATQAT